MGQTQMSVHIDYVILCFHICLEVKVNFENGGVVKNLFLKKKKNVKEIDWFQVLGCEK